MMIAVRFPDGSVRQAPAQLREITDPHRPDALPTFELVPLNSDSHWRFVRHDACWHATPRTGALMVLRPARTEWWRSVAHMDDPARPATKKQRQRQSSHRASAA